MMKTRSSIKAAVRGAVILTALVGITIYTVLKSPEIQPYSSKSQPSNGLLATIYRRIISKDIVPPERATSRRLFSLDSTSPPLVGDDDDDNCTDPRGVHKGYNNSCAFVLDQCQGEVSLINYMAFVLCDLANVQVLGYILLALWLLYLISLLATTADNFFVPPLNLLSEKLRLSPSIAGITLLAIGNGAPDVFTAYAALQNDDIQLLLGALIGASIFISTVVLGTIILVTTIKKDDIDKIDFVRDVVAYMITVALVIGVAFDGDVRLWEAVLFPLFYFLYLAVAISIAYLRRYLEKVRQKRRNAPSETSPLLRQNSEIINDRVLVEQISATLVKKDDEKEKKRLTLLGLTWPRGSNIAVKIQWFIEWPFSLLRWLSVPPCYYDDQWGEWHHWFVVTSPVPMAMLLLIAAQGWSGFTDFYIGLIPLYVFLIMWGLVISSVLYFVVKSYRPPHWSMQIVLGILAFIMSIAWLNIIANEVVAVLQAFGLLFGIDTAILGLTVLAIGNSVGDWVADTAVARAGKPGMGVASCFGSPLLNDVLGLSVALLAKMATNGGKPYTFPIHSPAFDRVKLSWIFLGISLLSSVIVFPLFKFSPPKPFGVALLYFYIVFMVFSILDQVGILQIHFS